MSGAHVRLQKLENGPLDEGLKSALDMHESYTGPILVEPEFPGTEIATFFNRYPTFSDTNNLSMVTFVHCGKFNVVVPGDLEAAGWRELLKNVAFRERLKRTNVFIASHHGRENGYCREVFGYCSPELVVISDSDKQYESQEHCYDEHASGVLFPNGVTRKVLTTRRDGHVSFYVNAAGATVRTTSTTPVIRRNLFQPLQPPFRAY